MAQIVLPVVLLAWAVYFSYFVIYKGHQKNMQDKEEGDVWLPDPSYSPSFVPPVSNPK